MYGHSLYSSCSALPHIIYTSTGHLKLTLILVLIRAAHLDRAWPFALYLAPSKVNLLTGSGVIGRVITADREREKKKKRERKRQEEEKKEEVERLNEIESYFFLAVVCWIMYVYVSVC